MRFIRFVLFVAVAMVLLSSLPGCTASGEKFTTLQQMPADKGVVYIFRMSSIVGGARRPDILVDSQNLGGLSQDGYYAVMLSPGVHILMSELQGMTATRSLNVEAGKTYYFQQEFGWSFTLKLLNEAEGLENVSKCRIEKPLITDLDSFHR